MSITVLLVVLTFSRLDLFRSSSLDITLLSVGQGDSILVEFPGDKRMLIDGGPAIEGRYDSGARIVAPFLYDRRISRIDYLVASHGQSDHYGGLAAIAEAFRPKALWIGPPLGCEAPGYEGFIAACARKGIAVRQLCRSTKPFFINGVKLEVLGPACPPQDVVFKRGVCSQEINNFSLVIRLTFGTVNILLTGDMEVKAERELLDARLDIRADILKVAHHGSRSSTSEAFLDTVKPEVALISAGFGNHFGFPQDEVIHRLQSRGIRLLRTDIDGAVRIRCDGNRMKIKPFYNKKQVLWPEGRLDPYY